MDTYMCMAGFLFCSPKTTTTLLMGYVKVKVLVTQSRLTLCNSKDCMSRQEYWSGQSFYSPGDLPNPGIELEDLGFAGKLFTI